MGNEKSTTYKMSAERQQFLEALPIPMSVYHVVDGKYTLLLVTDGMCRLLQRDREVILKESHERYACYIHPDDFQVRLEMDSYAFLHRKKTSNNLYRLRMPDGEYVWVSCSGNSEILDDGSNLFFRVYSDVSGVKEEQLFRRVSLLQRVTRFQEVFDALDVAVFWKDKNQRFLGANRAFLESFGVDSLDDILGRSGDELSRLVEKDMFYADEKKVLSKGVATYRLHGHAVLNGMLRDIVVSKSPIFDNGDIVGFVGVFEDVTDEYEQRNRANKLTSIIDNIPIGLCVFQLKDGAMKCVAVNKELLGYVSLTPELMIGHTFGEIAELFHPDEVLSLKQDELEFLQGKREYYKAYRLRTVNGYTWFRLMVNYVELGGRRQIFMTFTDISRAIEAKKSAAQAKQAYETAVNGAGLLVWQYNVSNSRLSLMDTRTSHELCEKVGMPIELENAPFSVFRFLTRESVADVLKLTNDMATGKPSSCTVCFKRLDGKFLYEELSCTYVEEKDGQPYIAYGIGRDVSDEKERDVLYEQEISLLHKANRPDVVAKGHIDLTDNRVIDYVTHTEFALGITPSMTFDEAARIIIDAVVDEKMHDEIAANITREALLKSFANGVNELKFEYHRKKNNMPAIFIELVINIFKTRNGNIECFIYGYDTTRKLMEREIIKRFADLGFEYAAIVDAKTGYIAFFNRQKGLTSDTAEGNKLIYGRELEKMCRLFVPEEQRREVTEKLALEKIVAELRQVNVYEYTYQAINPKDGSFMYHRVQATYLAENSETIFIAGSNITTQYEREMEQMQKLRDAAVRAERAMEARSMFLSSVSHDMRTPLNGIIGFTNFALQEKNDRQRQDYLEKIKLSSTLLLNLINDTLELSRIESGKVVLKPDTVNSRELIESIVVGIRVTAATKGIDFDTCIAEDFPETIEVDTLRIQETCLNLLSNAVKFTPAGGEVRMDVDWLGDTREDGMTCRIVVKDNGIGIGKKFLPRMFEPFAQESAGTGNSLGSGLGLSIVNRYVTLMGGTISVDSERGKGTTFTIYLPIVKSSEKVAAISEANSLSALAGKKVLLFEDNFLNCEIASILLEEQGMKVVHAEDGEVGVKIFSEAEPGTFDVILMDIRMPNMNGYEATQIIRAMDRPDAKTVPILAMTADALDEDVQHCLSVGMNSHLAKPIDPPRLFAELAKYLG